MTQNKSPAVMAQRIEPPDSLDDFPTPCWGTRALMEHVIMKHNPVRPRRIGTVVDPACGRGYMAHALREYFDVTHASDVFDYRPEWMFLEDDEQQALGDFTTEGLLPLGIKGDQVDWVITNPPFRLAHAFIQRALAVSGIGCAVLVRTAFLEGGTRYRELFSQTPPTMIAQFAERIILTKGIVRDPAKLYWDIDAKKWKRPTTATAYCWLVWVHGMRRQPFDWIPPCRFRMERAKDYPMLIR